MLRRLARDQRGNVLILWATFLIPLIALVGSGVDIGRGYVARNQMQTACDAAALAGRRAMSAASVDDVVKAEAAKFFNFNFTQGLYGTAPFTPTVTSSSTSSQTVVINAATTVPTTFMQMFGYTSLPISVTCDASQDFVNTDIVLVLDTTGSMADKATSSDTSTKIQALRAAVLALYDQLAPVQTQLAAAGLRLRYGVVPYASAVNTGAAIRSMSPNYMVSSTWKYQSRLLNTIKNSSSSACSGYSNSTYNSGTKYCYYFTYGQRSLDVSSYVAGASVDTNAVVGVVDTSSGSKPASTQTATNYVTWPGCIEERDTVIMSSTATAIPAGAYDLNIDLIPVDDSTRWRPYWPEVEYTSYKDNMYSSDLYKPQYACPSPAAMMQSWDRTTLSNYLNTLNPNGGTYHDNGMMWGARWDSANGIFGPNNPDTYNSMPVKKYIIFMTDGLFDTGYDTLYSAYGVEKLDGRVTGGGSSSNETDQLARHKQRFALLCSKAKSMGYSVWVIGFATTLDSSLTNCASNASQASTSANQAALLAKFVEIGKNIGALRLTQ